MTPEAGPAVPPHLDLLFERRPPQTPASTAEFDAFVAALAPELTALRPMLRAESYRARTRPPGRASSD